MLFRHAAMNPFLAHLTGKFLTSNRQSGACWRSWDAAGRLLAASRKAAFSGICLFPLLSLSHGDLSGLLWLITRPHRLGQVETIGEVENSDRAM